MADDPGVMGNLPRSRPGRRSSKRDGGRASKPAETTQASASGTKSAAGRSTSAKKASTAKRSTSTRKQTTGTRTPASGKGAAARTRASERPAPTADRQESAGGTDPVTGAVLLAGKVVEGGLKVAGGIIKRLPRP